MEHLSFQALFDKYYDFFDEYLYRQRVLYVLVCFIHRHRALVTVCLVVLVKKKTFRSGFWHLLDNNNMGFLGGFFTKNILMRSYRQPVIFTQPFIFLPANSCLA